MIIRRLSALGLVLTAVLGLAAVWTASASALGEKFHTEIVPTVLTGSTGEETFTVGGFSIKCQGTVSGTWTIKTPETMTLHPTYGGLGACEDSLGRKASILTTGCNLVYWSEVLGASDAKVEVECEAGQVIKVATEGCTMTIGPQGNLGATYANGTVGGVPEITVKSTWEAGFPVKHGLCPEIAGNKGKFTGSTTVKGYVDECAAGECPFAPGGVGDKDAYKEGNVVGISWK
ncbi:MAG TPA: hypothetical protein VF125_13315 [Solirubrobacterales bacterium]